MRLNRGCGCLVLLLLVVDVFVIIGALIGLLSGPREITTTTSTFSSVLALLIGIGNTVICVLVLVVAFRGRREGGSTTEPLLTETEGEAEAEPTEDDE